MKKYISSIVFIAFTFNVLLFMNFIPIEVRAETATKIKEESMPGKLSRADCLIFVVAAIGGKMNVLIESYGVTKDTYDMVICDSSDEILGDGTHEEFFRTFYYEDKCIFSSVELKQVDIATQYAKIVYGEYTCGPANEYVYFNFFRNVTLEEATAFMVRCLRPDNIDLKDLSATFESAKNMGLVLESDEFYNEPKHELTLDEFKVILHRFLKKPRGIFHNPKSFIDFSSYTYDSEHIKTYYDTLSERYTDEYINALLSYDGSEELVWADDYIKDSFWDKIPLY